MSPRNQRTNQRNQRANQRNSRINQKRKSQKEYEKRIRCIFSYRFRKYCFENWRELAEEVKLFLSNRIDDFELYVFGSVVEGGWCVGTSDIDIAVISKKFEDRELSSDIFNALRDKFLEIPFEFHILTPKKWELLKKLARKFEKI